MNPYIQLSPEVEAALQAGKPVVALESTIISHGMPYPQNVETALECQRICRENGAVPATCAVIGGKLCAGLTDSSSKGRPSSGRRPCRPLPGDRSMRRKRDERSPHFFMRRLVVARFWYTNRPPTCAGGLFF